MCTRAPSRSRGYQQARLRPGTPLGASLSIQYMHLPEGGGCVAAFLLIWPSNGRPLIDKGKPGASRGRKATGPTRSAGPPNSKGLSHASDNPVRPPIGQARPSSNAGRSRSDRHRRYHACRSRWGSVSYPRGSPRLRRAQDHPRVSIPSGLASALRAMTRALFPCDQSWQHMTRKDLFNVSN
jgi:hypothetical protein